MKQQDKTFSENEDTLNLSKLTWSCRRGMLELDVLLTNFLKEAYPHLPSLQKQFFAELLSCHDTDLFSWLLGHKVAPTERLSTIVEAIRQHARSRV